MLREAITVCGLSAGHEKPKLRAAEEDAASPDKMKELNLNPEDAKLGSLLREARATPSLPPRFQENVWRRIDDAAPRDLPVGNGNWLNALAGWILRPRRALAVAAVLVLAGVGLGWNQGEQLAQHEAQARYLTAVAPNSLR